MNCLICNEALSTGQYVCVKRGLHSIIDASKRRGDDLWKQLDGVSSIELHEACRKHYTRNTSIEAAASKSLGPASNPSSPVKKKLRTSDDFSIQQCCFYCGKKCSILLERKKRTELREVIFNVKHEDVKCKVLQRCVARGNDSWASEVRGRVESSLSLVADGARYHESCQKRFCIGTIASTSDLGRPIDTKKHESIAKVCQYLNDDDDCQYILKDLVCIAGTDVFTEGYFKQQLQNIYGDKIVFTARKGVGTIVTMRSRCDEILSGKWRNEKVQDEFLERMRIVEAAARIIREDIRLQIYDTSTCPTPSSLASSSTDAIPETLEYFLEEVITKQKKTPMDELKKKYITIAHSIIAATRPRSFVSSLLTGESCFNSFKRSSEMLEDDSDDEIITVEGFDF